MMIITSENLEAPTVGLESDDFTVIAYATSKERELSGLDGDAAVRFQQLDDGSVRVIVQRKPSGQYAKTETMADFIIHPWNN
jgi:hypothetical protein